MKLSSIAVGSLALCLGLVNSYASENYTNQEIYSQMCTKCHGSNAEGNPEKKGPSLNNLNMNEIELLLYDLKAGGLNQSSGTDHEIMEHNMGKIIEKGMNFDPKKMAEYIYFSFNPESKYLNKLSNEKTYSVSEVYEFTCSKCHGRNGEGNPEKKGPALSTLSAHEIEQALEEIKGGTVTQSSGTDHEVMEHNQKKIAQKGINYTSKEMAEYISSQFGK